MFSSLKGKHIGASKCVTVLCQATDCMQELAPNHTISVESAMRLYVFRKDLSLGVRCMACFGLHLVLMNLFSYFT